MRPLPLPIDRVANCIVALQAGSAAASTKAKLLAAETQLLDAESEYLAAGIGNALHAIVPNEALIGYSPREIENLYASNLMRRKASRPILDRIRREAHGICPLCNQRHVNTIDHFLPKAFFPRLAITPANLVPACWDCNHAKLDYFADSEANGLLHPYFDDLDDKTWLEAKFIIDEQIVVQYSVSEMSGVSDTERKRLQVHFQKLDLGALYAVEAARELSGSHLTFATLAKKAGPEVLRTHFALQAESWRAKGRNHQRHVLYRAAAASAELCDFYAKTDDS